MPLSPDRYLESLRVDVTEMATAARAAGLDAPVPLCGDWTVKDLVEHTGMVHQSIGETVRRRATERVSRRELQPPPADGTIEWFEAGAERTAQILEEAGPDEDVWNWAGAEPKSAFW